MGATRRIYNYTTKETEELIEGVLAERKSGYGICYNYMIERWLLMGIARDGDDEQKEKAREILMKRFKTTI